jgi:hypothetical protein
VQGISLLALAARERWTAARIRRTLADEVDVVLGKATSTS